MTSSLLIPVTVGLCSLLLLSLYYILRYKNRNKIYMIIKVGEISDK